MADEIDDATLDAGRRANIDARDGEVDRALASSNFAMAVHKALENPPLGTKDQEVKEMNTAVVSKALLAVNQDTEIKNIVKDLPDELIDTLMKYVYKGLSTPENAPNFLKWHGYIVTRAGVGCIVRSMTDRKTV